MTNPNLTAALAWLDGPWQAADNKREAAQAAASIRQLRGNLSLAEEGLANYALEVERLRSALRGIMLDESPPDRSVSVWLRERACEALGKQPNALEPCEGPASLVGALQDVVHTDAGPVRAGRSVKSEGAPRGAGSEPLADEGCAKCGFSKENHDNPDEFVPK